MPGMNPMQFIQLIRNGRNPQQLAMGMLENESSNNPLVANLLQLAKGNQSADIETVARNLCRERGVDFDTAFNSFKRNLGL